MSNRKYVRLEMFGNVGVVTFSNPPHNFISLQALEEFQWALKKLDDDNHCRAIVLAAEERCSALVQISRWIRQKESILIRYCQISTALP